MRLSLNEVQSKVRDAARGAGAPEGAAEDAALAARRLAVWDLPWCDPLAAALAAFAAGDAALDPSDNRPLAAPLAAESVIDLARAGLPSPPPFRALGAVYFVPAAFRADFVGIVSLGAVARVCSKGLYADRLDVTEAWDMTVSFDEGVGELPLLADRGTLGVRAAAGIEVEDSSWARLQEFVRRTHVPASAQSRARGAGAGLIDDD